jgi:uncharacterized membrane protein YfcA
MKLGPYVWLGQLDADALMTATLFAPLAAASVWLGWWLHSRVDERLFYRIANGLLVATCLKLVWDGARDLMAG